MTLAFKREMEIMAAEDRGMSPYKARQLLRQLQARASAETRAALDLAIQLLTKRIYERQMGRKGARIRRRKYSVADFRRWGRLGGRPKKKHGQD